MKKAPVGRLEWDCGIAGLVSSCGNSHRDLRMRSFLRSESGIAVTEYGLLIALIAVVLIGVVTVFGSQIGSWFAAKTNTITSW